MRRTTMRPLRQVHAAFVALLLFHVAVAAAHWPDQPAHRIAYLGDFTVERGGVIPNVKLSYVTHGKLNATRDNAILFLHAFGMNHHQIDHFIGPGRPLDTNRYFVICPDVLGNTQTTFEHSTSPSNSGLKMKFPAYIGRDVVRANYMLVKEALGVERLFAVVGIARGGGLGMQFAVSYPDFADSLVVISGGVRWGSTILFRLPMVIALIEACDGWQGGNYDTNPAHCMRNAMSFLAPYMYTPDWWSRHVDTPEAFTKWRNTLGAYFFDVQDARDVYYVFKSGGPGAGLGGTPGFNGNLDAALAAIKAKTLFLGSPQDEDLVPEHIEEQARKIPDAQAVWVDSIAGHNVCCNADPQSTRALGEALRRFLDEVRSSRRDGR